MSLGARALIPVLLALPTPVKLVVAALRMLRFAIIGTGVGARHVEGEDRIDSGARVHPGDEVYPRRFRADGAVGRQTLRQENLGQAAVLAHGKRCPSGRVA